MRPLADAACELPWLAPCAGSLVALTRQPQSGLWSTLRGDPGLVLLLLRQPAHHEAASALSFYSSLLRDPGVLELALECLGLPEPAFVDWHKPALLPTYQAALACAQAAESIARQTDRCDVEHAWVGGLLAPLGWMAAAVGSGQWAVGSGRRSECNESEIRHTDQRKPPLLSIANIDGPAIARRLATSWRLPAWLSAVVGHLALPLETACALGADPDLFLIVQLAATLVNQAGLGIRLLVGGSREELARALDLTGEALQTTCAKLQEAALTAAPPREWQAPASIPLLPDLLRLALANRRTAQFAACERLHAKIDALHDVAQRLRSNEGQRLQEMKLEALAELAAGAGHEINNPLAVISGQAQYLLVSEQEPARRKALQTIVGQTQRIHQTLTQLMQFARPPVPHKQRIDLGGLLSEVAGGLQALADERQVCLTCPDLLTAQTLLVDPAQMRTALTGLLRNAIEAAPANGWASLKVQYDAHGVTFTFEDSGPGPTPADREHLFDPFYCGRKAGRGRGLGLPTAWQLARQHGGDVRFDTQQQAPTRFLLTLPAEALVDTLPLHPERNGTCSTHSIAQSA